jgi:ABC-type sulfate transport system substrate-binding protein
MSVLFTATPEEQTLQLARDIAQGSLNFLRASFNNGQRLVWDNPYGLTPQQALDCLDGSAADLVRMSQALAVFINSFAPEESHVTSMMPQGATVALNADGTVTITGV